MFIIDGHEQHPPKHECLGSVARDEQARESSKRVFRLRWLGHVCTSLFARQPHKLTCQCVQELYVHIGLCLGSKWVEFKSESGKKGGPKQVGVSGVWEWGSPGGSGSVSPSESCNSIVLVLVLVLVLASCFVILILLFLVLPSGILVCFLFSSVTFVTPCFSFSFHELGEQEMMKKTDEIDQKAKEEEEKKCRRL